MKNLIMSFGVVILLAVFSTQGFSQGRQQKGQGRGQGRAMAGGGMQQRGGGQGGQFGRGRTTAGTLDNAASEQLLRMWEEEKLARDVYTTLARSSNQPIFTNIAGSESKHMQAVGRLIQSGAGAAKLNDAPGVFSYPEYQQLYQSLIAGGSKSPLDALYVGAKIEEMDIADLRQLLSQTTDQRMRQTLENLLRGSENHLRAFASQIAKNGGSYDAQFLSQADFDQIANSSGQGGRQSGGQGRGKQSGGQGKGNGGQFGSMQGRQFSSQFGGSSGQSRQAQNRGGRGGNGRRGR